MSEIDNRVPYDRMTIIKEGAYYTHIIKGMCIKHGLTVFECQHPDKDSKDNDLVIVCMKCEAENTIKENPIENG